MSTKTKTTFQLDSPYTSPSWPDIAPDDQDTIFELLYTLLCPIGKHKLNHTAASKGKRAKKRKRQAEKLEPAVEPEAIPAPPEILHFVQIGLNSINKSLQLSSKKSRPHDTASGNVDTDTHPEDTTAEASVGKDSSPAPHFAAVFVLKSARPSILHEHLPALIAAASLAHPDLPATRLVELPNGCEQRLCEALGLPRVSFIGLADKAPYSKALVELIRKSVPDIQSPWSREIETTRYHPVKINVIETRVPDKPPAKKSKT